MVSCTLFPLGYLRKFFGGKTMELKAIYKEIGKTLAPVEIESEEAMRDFGITKKDLVPLTVGLKHIMIYPYPAPEEVCREMLKELKNRYKQEAYRERCLICDEKGQQRICPEKYSCATCPVAREERRPRHVSLEALEEEGLEMEAQDTDVLESVELDLFLEGLQQYNPQYARIVALKKEGYTEAEIGRFLQLPRHTVMYSWKRIRELAAGYFGSFGKSVFN